MSGFIGGGGGLSDPMTTRGDVIIRDATNVTARLAIGGAGEGLLSDGTDIAWGAITATAAGLDTQVQFNDAGAIGAEAAFTYNKGTDTLTAVNMAAAFTGNLTGQADTVATITGLAPDTATTQATQGNITSLGTLTGLTVSGATALTGATSLTLGTASTNVGGMTLQNATNANTVIINSGVTSGSYTLTLPLAVAGAGEVLTDAAGDGVLSWAAPAGGGNTLDAAYDQGGAGVGRTIAADSGGVQITSTGTTADGSALDIIGDSLTSGSLAKIYSNTAGDGGELLLIHNDNNGGNQVTLKLVNDSNSNHALEIVTFSNDSDVLEMNANFLTTGSMALLYSSSADASARNLIELHNASSSAVGAVPIDINQAAVISTNFKKYIVLDGNAIYVSDGTSPEGNLTGVLGDICLNGTGGATFFCDTNGTNWTTMA